MTTMRSHTALAIALAMVIAAYVTGCKSSTTRTSTSSGTDSLDGMAPAYAPLDLNQSPEYLYSIPASGEATMSQPMGVCVADDEILVADAGVGQVLVYDLEGKRLRSFGDESLDVPLGIATNPANDNIYVSDHRSHDIEVFTPRGEHVRTFDPDLPESGTDADSWAPRYVAFAGDGSMYVTDISNNNHRFVIFDPDGAFVRTVGALGSVDDPAGSPGDFYFPTGIEVCGSEVWVSDQNNGRIQVFDLSGEFIRIVVTGGIPRGLAFGPGGEAAVVDALAHCVDVYGADGTRLASFGEPGVGEGQFIYPNDLAIAADRIFITDRENARVEVWGIPAEQ